MWSVEDIEVKDVVGEGCWRRMKWKIWWVEDVRGGCGGWRIRRWAGMYMAGLIYFPFLWKIFATTSALSSSSIGM
jgi:hypothetical protein